MFWTQNQLPIHLISANRLDACEISVISWGFFYIFLYFRSYIPSEFATVETYMDKWRIDNLLASPEYNIKAGHSNNQNNGERCTKWNRDSRLGHPHRAEQTLLIPLNPLRLKVVSQFNLPIMNIAFRLDRMHVYLLSRDDIEITLCFHDLHCNGRVSVFEEHAAGHHESYSVGISFLSPTLIFSGLFSVFV